MKYIYSYMISYNFKDVFTHLLTSNETFMQEDKM